MRKALIPMLASLALCGAATTALVISSARAQPSGHNPVMVTAPGLQLAANDTPPDGAPPQRDMQRGMRDRDPAEMATRIKQMCQDHYARQAGELTYLETRLTLTPSEQALFQRWKDAKLNISHRQADQCAQRPVPQRQASQTQGAKTERVRPSPADMMAREEDRLKQRLTDIQEERPALTAFYNSLSPEQKKELTRASMRGRDGMERGHRMFAGGPRGPMGEDRMGEGRMGPGMERPPAPPPEQ